MLDPAVSKGIRGAVYYRKIIGGLGVAIILASIATDGFQGETKYSTDTGWYVSNAMDPWTLPLSPIAAAVLILSWRLPAQPRSAIPARWFWVYLAFFVDFALFAIAAGPPIYLVNLSIEAITAGEFHWSFERTHPRSTDFIGSGLALIPTAIYLLWFGRLPWMRRETPGCICTGVTFTASTPAPRWWQPALVPIKIVGLCFPFLVWFQLGKRSLDDLGGFQVRCSR